MSLFGGFSVNENCPSRKLKNVIQETLVLWCSCVCNGTSLCLCVFQLCRFQKTLCPTSVDRAIVADVEGRGGKVCALTLCIVVSIVACALLYQHYSADDRKGPGDGPVSILLSVKVKLSWRMHINLGHQSKL